MQEVIAILIAAIFGVIALSGVVIDYFVEVQKIDRTEIEYWKRKAEKARLFEVYIAKMASNGIRKVFMRKRAS